MNPKGEILIVGLKAIGVRRKLTGQCKMCPLPTFPKPSHYQESPSLCLPQIFQMSTETPPPFPAGLQFSGTEPQVDPKPVSLETRFFPSAGTAFSESWPWSIINKTSSACTKGIESEPRRSLVLDDNEAIAAYIKMAILQYDENSSLWRLPGRAIS